MTILQRRATDRLIVLSATGLFSLTLCSVWLSGPSGWELALFASALLLWALLLSICLYAFVGQTHALPPAGDPLDPLKRAPHVRIWLLGAAMATTLGFAITAALGTRAQPSPQPAVFSVASWTHLALLAIGVGAFVASLRSSRLRPMLRVIGLVLGTAGLGNLSLTLSMDSRIEQIAQREAEVTMTVDLTPLLSELEVQHLVDVQGFESGRWETDCAAIPDVTTMATRGRLVGLVAVGRADQWPLRGGSTAGAKSNRDLARRRAEQVAECLRQRFSGAVVPLAGGALNLGSGLDHAHYAEDRIVEVFGLVTLPGSLQEQTFPVRYMPAPVAGRRGSVAAAEEPGMSKPALSASLP